MYSYTVETLEEENGKCNVCSAITNYRCQKCNTFYCSRQCQSKDWPIHKTQCEQLPLVFIPFFFLNLLKNYKI